MIEKEILQKKELVDKYLNKKKNVSLLDAFFYNIDGASIYIRIDFIDKNSTYRINWVNLSSMEDNNVEYWVNTNLVYPTTIEKIKNIIINNAKVEDYQDYDDINSKISINFYLKDYEYNKNSFEFKRYIPKCWSFLADILVMVFEGMPKYMYQLFLITVEKIISPDINCVFNFDLEKDDFNRLFNKEVISQGKKYYKDERVIFLEKKDGIYNSVVYDSNNYLVSIIYKENTKEVQMTCNCQNESFCKHIYASLMAIKNNEEYKFFKIASIDDNKSIIDNLQTFNYLLCVGIVDDYFVVIDNYDYAFIPILEDNKLLFKIVEDDDEKSLEKELNDYLKKHQK